MGGGERIELALLLPRQPGTQGGGKIDAAEMIAPRHAVEERSSQSGSVASNASSERFGPAFVLVAQEGDPLAPFSELLTPR